MNLHRNSQMLSHLLTLSLTLALVSSVVAILSVFVLLPLFTSAPNYE
jgi:hypothetical protein